MKIRKYIVATVPALLAMSLTGCGGSTFTKDELTQARNAVAQAEQRDIDKSGAIALETAKDKIARADRAFEEGEEEQAARLASEARVDAEFAVAVSQAQRAQRAAQELSASIETLRQETQRSPDGSSLSSPAATPAPLAPPQPPSSRGQ